MMNKHIFVPLLLALAFAAVYQAQGCSLAATEYTSAGCSAANLVGCQRFTDLVENTDCTAITSSLNSSQTLYVKISNCSSSTYSVHLDSACTSDAVTVANDCSSSAPFFSFALFADGTNATLAPYCAQGANQTCRIALLSYNNRECTEYLGCIDNLARGGDKDGVCIYEQRLGLYLLPRCQTEELVISNQPSCTGGLTKTFPKIPISLQGAGTCSPYGSNDTTFAAYFLASNEGGCGSASVMTSWISLLFSFLF